MLFPGLELFLFPEFVKPFFFPPFYEGREKGFLRGIFNERFFRMTNRRDFLKTAAVGAAAVSTLSIAQSAHAAGSDTLRVGLVGCGGRGRGALKNSLDADPNTVVTAFGDLFPETAQRTFDQYKNNPRCKATQDTVFSGFDSYKGVIENCDVVILEIGRAHV